MAKDDLEAILDAETRDDAIYLGDSTITFDGSLKRTYDFSEITYYHELLEAPSFYWVNDDFLKEKLSDKMDGN